MALVWRKFYLERVDFVVKSEFITVELIMEPEHFGIDKRWLEPLTVPSFGARSTPSRPPSERFLMSTFRLRLPLAHLAFIATLPLAIGAQLTMANAQALSLITTNGVASTEVVPDIAIISLGVDTERPKAAAAARDNALAVQAIVGERRRTSRRYRSRSRLITTRSATTTAASPNGRCAGTWPTIR